MGSRMAAAAHLKHSKAAQQQLDLAHVRLHPQRGRVGGHDPQIQAHIPVPRRRRRVVVRVQAVLDSEDKHVRVLGDEAEAGDEVVERVEDDALSAHIHEPGHVLREGVGGLGAHCL